MAIEKYKLELDQYIIRKKSLLNTGTYFIEDINSAPILFATAPFFQFNWKVDVYDSEKKIQKYFTIAQDRFSFITTIYRIKDENGVCIGQIKGRPLFGNASWEIADANNQKLGNVNEKIVSFGIDMLLKTQKFSGFNILLKDEEVGDITTQLSVLDRYNLNLSKDSQKRFDRRIAIAVTIALDAALKR